MAKLADVQVIGDRALIANIYATNQEVGQRIRLANERWARRVWERARIETPYDTGRLRGAHNYELSRDRLVFTVFVDHRIFEAEGLPYYPLWVHEGTSRMPARPWLRQAYERESPGYRRDISREIKVALRERRRSR